MARMHKAPATIFLTTSIMPVIPGATLFYMMLGFVQADYSLAFQQTILLAQTCLAIAFGFFTGGNCNQVCQTVKKTCEKGERRT